MAHITDELIQYLSECPGHPLTIYGVMENPGSELSSFQTASPFPVSVKELTGAILHLAVLFSERIAVRGYDFQPRPISALSTANGSARIAAEVVARHRRAQGNQMISSKSVFDDTIACGISPGGAREGAAVGTGRVGGFIETESGRMVDLVKNWVDELAYVRSDLRWSRRISLVSPRV